jgi:hypothetical protein
MVIKPFQIPSLFIIIKIANGSIKRLGSYAPPPPVSFSSFHACCFGISSPVLARALNLLGGIRTVIVRDKYAHERVDPAVHSVLDLDRSRIVMPLERR